MEELLYITIGVIKGFLITWFVRLKRIEEQLKNNIQDNKALKNELNKKQIYLDNQEKELKELRNFKLSLSNNNIKQEIELSFLLEKLETLERNSKDIKNELELTQEKFNIRDKDSKVKEEKISYLSDILEKQSKTIEDLDVERKKVFELKKEKLLIQKDVEVLTEEKANLIIKSNKLEEKYHKKVDEVNLLNQKITQKNTNFEFQEKNLERLNNENFNFKLNIKEKDKELIKKIDILLRNK